MTPCPRWNRSSMPIARLLRFIPIKSGSTSTRSSKILAKAMRCGPRSNENGEGRDAWRLYACRFGTSKTAALDPAKKILLAKRKTCCGRLMILE